MERSNSDKWQLACLKYYKQASCHLSEFVEGSAP